jgi:hypothetical protein
MNDQQKNLTDNCDTNQKPTGAVHIPPAGSGGTFWQSPTLKGIATLPSSGI